jgi:hypothetical protein
VTLPAAAQPRATKLAVVLVTAILSSSLAAPADAQEGPPGQRAPRAARRSAPAVTAPEAASQEAPEPGLPDVAATPVGSQPAAPGPGSPTADPGPSAIPTPPDGPRRRLIVVDAATYGIDPIVGRVVTDRMRRTGAEMGYQVLDPIATATATARLRMPYPPTPADLWRATWIAQAERGAFARVWAAEGRYVIEVMVASLDGTGPFFGRDTAGSSDLREVTDRLLRAALPPPTQWLQLAPATGARTPPTPWLQIAPATGARPGVAARPRWRERPREELAHPGGIGVRLPEPPFRRWSLTLQTEAMIGTTRGGFYNHLLGARLDLRITRELMIGAYVGYANLQGRHNRAHNLLFLLQGELRVRLGPSIDLTIPLRAGVGYLPFNGPVVRLAAGLNYPLSPDFEIGVDLIAPTIWMLPSNVAVSLDLAIEATYRFP